MDRAWIFSVIVLVLIFVPGFFVCIFHTIWIDYTKHRKRLIELSFGADSVYMTQRLDYVAAQCISMAPLFAYTIRYKKDILKSTRRAESPLNPVLHLNKNYLKLLEEFPFYCKFYRMCYLLSIIGGIFGGTFFLIVKYF
jgi:hypothetical protein